MDLSRLSNDDLLAISNNDYASLSDDALKMLSNQVPSKPAKEFSWGEMASNILPSGRQYVEDIAGGLKQAATSPIDTAASLGKMIVGGAQRAIPGKQEWEQRYFDPVAQLYSDRYGSWEQFKQTAMQDPVGTLGDVALAPTAAGIGLKGAGLAAKGAGALKGAGAVGTVGKTLGAVGGKLLATGAALDPLSLAYNASLRPLGRAASHIFVGPDKPAEIFSSAAKWPKAVGEAQDKIDLSNIALREGIRPTRAGARKLKKKLDPLFKQYDDAIDVMTKEGGGISREALFSKFNQIIDDLGSPFTLSGADNKADILAVKQKFIDNLDEAYPGETILTPKQVDKFKKAAYRDLRKMKAFNPNQQPVTQGKKAAYRTAASSAREELINLADTVKKAAGDRGSSYPSGSDFVALSDQTSDLMRLNQFINDPAGRLTNLNMMGLAASMRPGAGAMVGGAVGGPVGAKLGAVGGAALAGLDNPNVKFKLAESLYKARNSPILDPRGSDLAKWRQILAEIEQYLQAGVPIEPPVAPQQ